MTHSFPTRRSSDLINLVRVPVGQISPHVPGFDAVEATKTLLGAFELIDNERHLIELFAYESLGCRTVHFALHSLCHGGVLFLLPACELDRKSTRLNSSH